MINSDGFAVSFGKGTRIGALNIPPTQIYYCGRKIGPPHQCPCGRCDGRCGPTNGCPCNSCKELTLLGGPHLDDYVKCPQGHRMCLSGNLLSWNCDNRTGGCPRNREPQRPRWRCIDESCDFDYCGVCYTSKLLSQKFVVNCEGAKAIKSFDYFHTKSTRHYCGRVVGVGRYANDCRMCDGRCGPSAGCQCRACFLLDNPKFLSPSALNRTDHSNISQQRRSSSPSNILLQDISSPHIIYQNGDFYIGEFSNGLRQGIGTYLKLSGRGGSTSSPLYLGFPGEWNENKLVKYLSYQNVWWVCSNSNSSSLSPSLSSSRCLTPLPPDPSRPPFDLNLLLSAEYLWIGNYFLVKFEKKIIFLENYLPSPLPSPTSTSTASSNLSSSSGVVVHGVWSQQGLSFTLQFSNNFTSIVSGKIIYLPTNSLVLSFGSSSNSSPPHEEKEEEAVVVALEYQPMLINQQLFFQEK